MYEVEIKINFRSGHRLLNYEGKCKNPHGEGYTAIILLSGRKLNKADILFDFGVTKKQIKEWINENWDHAVLSNEKDVDYIKFMEENNFKVYKMKGNPSAEKIAELLYTILKNKFKLPVKKVGIVESFEDSIAWYYEGG